MTKFTNVTIAFLFFLAFPAKSQNPYFQESFLNVLPMTCPFDSTKTVLWPEGWSLYQTIDGTMDGPVDSSRCISAIPIGGGGFDVPLADLDIKKPLFARINPERITELLVDPIMKPNYLYELTVCLAMSSFTNEEIVAGTACSDGICTGAWVGIGIPDSNGINGAATRVQTAIYEEGFNFFCQNSIISCFPTEKFDTQTLNSLLVKITFDSNATTVNNYLKIFFAGIFESFFDQPGLITTVDAKPFHYNAVTSEYDVPSWDTGGSLNSILAYTANTYPSPQNPSYVEAQPEPNTVVQETINLVIDEGQTIDAQPFVNLRGGLVGGSDTLRHIANLVNNGGDICLAFIDVVFSSKGEYQHGQGASLMFNNPGSCMQFREGSRIRVKEKATLHYGNQGAGILLICENSTIALEPDATLYFDGILMLSECDDASPSANIYMDLPKGSRFIFSENAKIHNAFSKDQAMKLYIKMSGGTIDLTSLSAEDREKIVLIYPDPNINIAENVNILPNPVLDNMVVALIVGKPELINLLWRDTNGRLLYTEKKQVEKGWNSFSPNLPAEQGIYFMTIQTNDGASTHKIVRL